MEFFDSWKTLNARFDEGDLTALTQLVGYKLFAIFDENRFPDSLPVSDRELQSRTGIKSGRTIVEARRRLKNAGLIEYETLPGKTTCYRLTGKHLVSTKEALSKHLVSTKEALTESSYIRARGPYTPNPNSLSDNTNAHAHAPVNRNSEVAQTSDLDIAQDFWSDEIQGGRLTIEHLSRLQGVIDRHGLEWLKAAMTEAGDANGSRYGTSPKLLFSVIDRKQNPKPKLKPIAGEQRAKQPKFLTYKPDPDIVYPWDVGGTDSEVKSSARGDKTASA